VNGFSFAESALEHIIDFFGAFFRTGPTGDALVHINIARVFFHLHREISSFAFHTLDFREGQEFYISMSSHLDQAGRDNSHRAVVGGEGLVQLAHYTANGRGPLHQINIVTTIRQIQGCLHTGYTTTNNQYRSAFGIRHLKSSSFWVPPNSFESFSSWPLFSGRKQLQTCRIFFEDTPGPAIPNPGYL
jgi:hypothetical protein